MKKIDFPALLHSKNLWLWIGAAVLAVIAIGGAMFLLPGGLGKLEITPTMVNAAGEIEPDTSFTVKLPSGMDETALREQLRFSAEVNYLLKAQEDGSYILTPIRPLEAGGSIEISYGNKKITYPVAKTLLVTSFMPINGSKDVPVHSGVEFEFNQDNVPLADFKAAISISPEIVGEVTQGDGRFVLYPQDSLAYGAQYTVTLRAPLVTPSGFALRETTTFTFTTITQLGEATEYLFSLSQSANTINVLSDEAPQAMVYLDERVTQTTVPEIEVKLYKYPTANEYMEQVERGRSNSSGKGGGSITPDISELQEFTSFKAAPFLAEENVGGKGRSNRYTVIFPEAMPIGNYAAEYSLVTEEKNADGTPYVIRRYQLMQSTDLSIFFMQTGDDLLLWVNDITAGTPVSGAQFRLTGDITASATTGEDGTALIHSEGMAVEDWRNNSGVFTVKAGERTFVDSQMFNPDNNSSPADDYISYLFCDRPIYRTSDTIKVWGMVRPRSSAVKAAAEYTLEFTGTDPIKVKPDAKGLFTAEISYQNLNSAWASVNLMHDSENSLSSVGLSIEDYTKPVYTVDSTPTKPVYMLGHDALPTVNFDVSLFDGTPVPAFEGKLESWDSEVRFKGGSLVKTDAKGRAAVELEIVETDNRGDTWYPQGYNYRFSNDAAESQNLYDYGNVSVIHRDVMLKGTPTVKDGKAEVTINTNKVDASRVKQSGDLWKENILKGTPTSTTVTATLKKEYYNKIYAGTTYDFITRQSSPRYTYERVEVDLQTYNVQTKAGEYVIKDIPCPEEEGVSYSLSIVANDSLNRPVRYTVQLGQPYEGYWRDSGDYRYSLVKQIDLENIKPIVTADGYSYSDTWGARYGFVDDESVTFGLQLNEKPVEKMTGKLLSATVQKGFANVSITDKATVTLPYSEALLPNYVMTGAYFDGRHAFILQDSYMSFNPEKRELDIKLKGDKGEYAPKDPVKLDATVTNKSTGKPAANAEVVVAVVDEAIFAIRGQYIDLLTKIYQSIYYPQISKYSSYTPPEYGGAGEKGGGGGDDIRSDFKDTAFFGTAKTDANGKAQFSFAMPDNITTWRATGLALTDDNQAGNTTDSLVATQNFFVTPVINETLVVGDSFAVGLRGAGKAVTEDDEVSYTVEVKGDNYDQTLTAQAKLRDYATVVFDPPMVGDYTVTIRARCRGGSDAVRLPFTVVPSGVERTLVNSFNLKDGIEVEPLRYPVRVELYSKTYRTYNRVLQSLINNSYGARSDMRIARKYTAQIMERDGGYWYYGSANEDINDLSDGGMLSVLPYTRKDIDLTARMMLAVPNMLSVSSVSGMYDHELTGVDGSPVSLYLVKALDKQMDADEIKAKLENTPTYNLVEKLTMSTALALAGDTETALANYETLVTPKLQKLTGISGEEVLYITGEGTISEKDCTAAASMLATVLGHKDAEQLMLYLIQKPSYYEPYIAEQLLFLSRFEPKETEKCKVSYTLNGEVKTEELDRYGISLSLGKSQLAAADFKVLSGEVYADVYYTGSAATTSDPAKKKLGITKTITPLEGGFESGKLVKITLTPDLSGFDKGIGDAEVIVDEYIPTGMRFERYGVTHTVPSKSYWWLQSHDGQRLRFSIYTNGLVVPLVYYARCSTPGEYVVESPFISSASADIWGTGPSSTITIN